MNFLTQKTVCKLWKCLHFPISEDCHVKFRNLQISKILNTDGNTIFLIPVTVMCMSLRYT